MIVIKYIFEIIGIITFCSILSIATLNLIERIRKGEIFHHQYELKCITSNEKDGECYDSTYTFVCQKCGKEKDIHTKGYNTFENNRNKRLKDGGQE